MQNTQEQIEKFIEDLKNSKDFNQLVQLHNLYCESINDFDSQIFELDDDFFDMLNWSGLRIVQACFYGSFNYSHDYITFDGYGNFLTFNNPENQLEYTETIARQIFESPEDFEGYFDQLDSILKEIEY